jgi:hypothetical protein
MAGGSERPHNDNRRRMSRPVGCLLWLVVLLVILIVAAVLFGGFQTGTKVNGAPRTAGLPVAALGLTPGAAAT